MQEQASVAGAADPAPGRVSRRQLLTAGGLAGLAGAVGVGVWLREREASAVTADRARVGHLLRRAGFAPTAAEVERAMRDGIEATTERLLHPEREDDSGLEGRLAAVDWDLSKPAELRRWWMTRMAWSERPLVEKMTLFWHGLLTSSFRKAGRNPELMRVQNDFLRSHALGKLRDLYVGISRDGAMLRWLDGTGSSRAHPNENYARELMELFTMGVGHYSETDVREAARALTGWVVDGQGRVRFRPAAHDGGTKTFLGRTGNLGLEDVVDAILANPATPVHLARRLWGFLAYPNVDDATLEPVVEACRRSGGDVREMVAAVLRHPAFYSRTAYRGLVKSPVELIVGFVRQHGLEVTAAVAGAGEAMGQSLLDPPNVAGWPGGPSWLSTGAWMARMRFLERVAATNAAAVHRALGGAAEPAALVDEALATLVDGDLQPEARAAILDHVRGVASGSSGAGDPLALAAADAAFLAGATPEYQLS